VDGHRLDPVAVEPGGQPRGLQLGAREAQHLTQLVAPDEVGEQLALAARLDREDGLADGLGGGVAGRYLDGGRIVEQLAGQAPHLVREGGREEQVLTPRRQLGQDALDVGQKAHVQHAVALVEDQHLDLPQAHRALREVVEQAAGGGHQDLDPTMQGPDLGVDVDPAVDGRGAQGDVAPVGPEGGLDLHGQLPGGGQDEGSNGMTSRREARVGVLLQALQDGQREGRRLARAGLGRREQVATSTDQGDSLELDGGRLRVPLLGDRAEQFGRQAELIEGQSGLRTHRSAQATHRPAPERWKGDRGAQHSASAGWGLASDDRSLRPCGASPRRRGTSPCPWRDRGA
jgi:hypothetical protein